jgi:hypothetical protein
MLASVGEGSGCKCVVWENTDIRGLPDLDATKLDSKEQCCEVCKRDARCYAYSISRDVTGATYCYIKGMTAGAVFDEGENKVLVLISLSLHVCMYVFRLSSCVYACMCVYVCVRLFVFVCMCVCILLYQVYARGGYVR